MPTTDHINAKENKLLVGVVHAFYECEIIIGAITLNFLMQVENIFFLHFVVFLLIIICSCNGFCLFNFLNCADRYFGNFLNYCAVVN